MTVKAAGMFAKVPVDCYVHDKDREGLAALKKVPGIGWALKQLVKHSYEKMVRFGQSANSVRVGSRSYLVLDAILEEVCDCLDLARPEMYVCMKAEPEARMTGAEVPVLVVSTGMLELLTEEEMFCVIAHELMHVKCGHMPYLMVNEFVRSFAEFLPVGGSVFLGPRLALEEWRLGAMFTCDRGAMMVTGNPDAMFSMLSKLGGSSADGFGAVEADLLREQARRFDDMVENDSLGRLYKLIMYLGEGQHFAPLRSCEAEVWAKSEEYAKIMAGDYPKDEVEEASCPYGNFAWQDAEAFASSNFQYCSEEDDQECPVNMVVDGLKTAASGAAGMVTGGASSFGKAINGLFSALQPRGWGGDADDDKQ